MKKLIVILTVCAFAIIGKISARAGDKVILQDIHHTSGSQDGLAK